MPVGIVPARFGEQAYWRKRNRHMRNILSPCTAHLQTGAGGKVRRCVARVLAPNEALLFAGRNKLAVDIQRGSWVVANGACET